MPLDRRQFLTAVGGLTATAAATGPATTALAAHSAHDNPDSLAVLVDTTLCIGCRHCEYACRKANGIEPGTLDSYDDTSVFDRHRRPQPESFTVVNRFEPDGGRAPSRYTPSSAACTATTRPAYRRASSEPWRSRTTGQ